MHPYMDVATESRALRPRIRKVSPARAPDSPLPGEDMDIRTARPENNTAAGCGLLLYNSDSIGTKRGLYRAGRWSRIGGTGRKSWTQQSWTGCKADAAPAARRCRAKIGAREGRVRQVIHTSSKVTYFCDGDV